MKTTRAKIITTAMIAGPGAFLLTELVRRQTELAKIADSAIASTLLFAVVLLVAAAITLAFVLGEHHE